MVRRSVTLVVAVAIVAAALVWIRGIDDPAVIGPADGSPFLRMTVEVDQNTNTVGILSHDLIRTKASPPLGMGPYLAVLDGANGPLAVVPVPMVRDVVEESRSPTGVTARTIPITRSAATIYVPFDSAATGVRVLDRSGTVKATLDADDLAPFTMALARPGAGALAPLWNVLDRPVHAATLADLQSAYPHIRFVTHRDGLANTSTKNIVATVRTSEPDVADRLLRALNFLSPELTGSISTLAVADFIPSATQVTGTDPGSCSYSITRGLTVGTEIVLNAADANMADCAPGMVEWTRLARTTAHEATHAFTNLTDYLNMLAPGAMFLEADGLPADVVSLAISAQKNLGARAGAMTESFAKLQETSTQVHAGYLPYAASNNALGTGPAVAAGFASGYGGTNARDDLAEYVELFFNPSLSEFVNPVCTQFSGLNQTIPKPSLLAFAKINFLRGIQLISEDQYRACVQNADPAVGAGFSINGIAFDQNLKADMISPDAPDPSRFVLVGSSSQSQAMLQITAAPPFYSALGFHRLDVSLGWATTYLPDKTFEGRNQLSVFPLSPSGNIDRTRRTRISAGGFALITNNLPGDTKGYLFFVPMDDWQARQMAFLDLSWFWVK
jgi:hypothetical protein